MLAVRPEQGCLLMDELAPASGHKRVTNGTKFRIAGKLDGVDIRFSTTVDAIQKGDQMVKVTISDE